MGTEQSRQQNAIRAYCAPGCSCMSLDLCRFTRENRIVFVEMLVENPSHALPSRLSYLELMVNEGDVTLYCTRPSHPHNPRLGPQEGLR